MNHRSTLLCSLKLFLLLRLSWLHSGPVRAIEESLRLTKKDSFVDCVLFGLSFALKQGCEAVVSQINNLVSVNSIQQRE